MYSDDKIMSQKYTPIEETSRRWSVPGSLVDGSRSIEDVDSAAIVPETEAGEDVGKCVLNITGSGGEHTC